MTDVGRFFQFLSKTDRHIVTHCTDHAVKTQTSYGVFVLLTGAFAFLSCLYAVNTTFHRYDIAIPVALLYSAVIIFIDREIVSAQKKTALLPRLALAAVVGLVISVPLEMRLFEKRIDQELKRMYTAENQPALDAKRQREEEFRQRVEAVEKDIRQYSQNIHDAGLAMQDEVVGAVRENKSRTGKAGRGPAYEEARQLKERNEELLAAAERSLERLRASQGEELGRIEQDFTTREVGKVDDFLARYEAMERAKSQSPATFWMSWGLRGLIMLIEIIPALMKLFQQENEYNAILEAMRRRNLTRVYSITNDHIDQLALNPHIVPAPTLLQQLEQDPLTR